MTLIRMRHERSHIDRKKEEVKELKKQFDSNINHKQRI